MHVYILIFFKIKVTWFYFIDLNGNILSLKYLSNNGGGVYFFFNSGKKKFCYYKDNTGTLYFTGVALGNVIFYYTYVTCYVGCSGCTSYGVNTCTAC